MKVIVAHPAQQHSYRLAAALSKKGYLYKYITTVYDKKNSLTHMMSRFLKEDDRERATGRRCEEICEDDVVLFCEAEGLLKLLVMRFPRLRPLYKILKYHSSDRFARKVVRYARRHRVDAVVGYDDYSSSMFRLLKKRAPNILRIMDVSAANILYMRRIYEKDMILQPGFADRLKKEREIVWNKYNRNRTIREITDAQIFLVPSSFAAKSLICSGVQKKSIQICPYGVDAGLFFPNRQASARMRGQPVRFIYVGGVKELKGISYLLQAFSSISESRATMTIVGKFNSADLDIKPYLNRVVFTGPVLHREVAQLLMNSDVFVFPSLGEGMSLSVMEAASCGLPLIISENAGIDAMTNGKEGFIVPIQSVDALREKMIWFIDHPECIMAMGNAAREMALQYTWDVYEQTISMIFDRIETGKWEE